jgi:hypothetical protein
MIYNYYFPQVESYDDSLNYLITSQKQNIIHTKKSSKQIH